MAQKRLSALEARIRSQKDKVLEYLRESGNISFACKRAGLTRETYYVWRADDEEFAKAAETAVVSGKSFVNDLAHNHLVRNIQDGNMGAIKFHLASCHPDYVRPRLDPPALPVSKVEIVIVDPEKYRARIKAESMEDEPEEP
jgi:hypothetical protein